MTPDPAAAGPPAPARVFLTAEWRSIVMLNYVVDPAVLEARVPRGTELDTHAGRTFVSLVGFRFLRTRVLGVAIPFHRNFDEVNLRFYVRRHAPGERRRGVVFIREIVPRRAIAVLAKALYNEPYFAAPMRSQVPPSGTVGPGRVQYGWKSPGGWHHIAITALGPAAGADPGSEAEFISEHYWGYTRQRDGSTIEYRVTHPRWRVWAGTDVEIQGDMGALYGREFGEVLREPPASAFLADGSAVTVFRPDSLDV